MEAACKDVERDRREIENTFQSRIIIAERDENAMKRAEQWRQERKGGPDDPDWKFAIKGSPKSCAKTLKDYVEAGVTHFTLLFADAAKLEPLRLFAKKVMPEFREK